MNNEELKKISGTISSVSFRSEETGFSVLYINTEDGTEECVVGTFPRYFPGETVVFLGTWTNHPIYGKQFKASFSESFLPQDENDILRFLSSGGIKGIGDATAAKIVKMFGNESLYVIENEPDKLTNIAGITYKVAEKISEDFHANISIRRIVSYFSSIGIEPQFAVSAYKKYGEEIEFIVRKNPFVLCQDGLGVPFETCDQIAVNNGIEQDSISRIKGGILFILEHNMNNGHICIPKDILLNKTSEFLSVEIKKAEESLQELCDESRTVCDEINNREYVYLSENFTSEEYIANKIIGMLEISIGHGTVSENEILEVEKNHGIKYEYKQKEAIRVAVENQVMILTGGPGTGKTTAIKGMIDLLLAKGKTVALAAPTGRAAKRMSEVTGRQAQTIHRLLEFNGVNSNGTMRFKHDSKDPLRYDVVIIDEMSMVDAKLFCALICALKLGSKLIMVGDPNQLPSVGAGNILKDLIESKKIPLINLNEIYRQSSTSEIVECAYRITHDDEPMFSINENDMFFIDAKSNEHAANITAELVSRRLPLKYGCNPINDIQVITPTRQGLCGTIELNKLLQNYINPSSPEKLEINVAGKIFRLGDKVMQIKNNYDTEWVTNSGTIGTGIFNGDIGKIIKISPKLKIATILFEDKTIEYSGDMLLELEHAYALTVHKSQGNEFDYVVIPIYELSPKLSYRKLIYTAITRAKKMLVLVGNEEIFNLMAATDRQSKRFTNLKSRIERLA